MNDRGICMNDVFFDNLSKRGGSIANWISAPKMPVPTRAVSPAKCYGQCVLHRNGPRMLQPGNPDRPFYLNNAHQSKCMRLNYDRLGKMRI
jgi:hypothetical protein